MNKPRGTLIAAIAVFFCGALSLLIGTTPVSAATTTSTQTVIINATAAAWENGIDTYYLTSNSTLRYIISNAIGVVDKVYVDGDLLDPSNYSVLDVTPRMIYLAVVLPPSYLETLELGAHDMDVVFTNTNVLSDVFYIEPALAPPSTGAGGFNAFMGGIGGALGTVISNPYVITIASSIAILSIVIVFIRHRSKLSVSGLKLNNNRTIIVSGVLALTAAATISAFILNNQPQPVSAAPATPELSITPSTLTYDLIVGGTGTLPFTSTVATPIIAGSYALTAVSNNTNSDINLNINGGSLSTFTTLPASPSTPLTIRNYTGNAYNGHNSSYNLAVTLDDYIAVGTYTIIITYKLDTEDNEFFQFTIDTRMTDTTFADGDTPATNPAHFSNTATTYRIPTSGQVNYTDNPYNWIIDWGDGTVQVASGISSPWDLASIPHTYATPGEYQITIAPNGVTTPGWLDVFGLNYFDDYDSVIMFKSVDTPITNNARTPGALYRFAVMFHGALNATTIPANLFSLISTSGDADLSGMFADTFSNYAYNSTTATIPSSLFSSINTSGATNMSSMFYDTFSYYAPNSVVGTIPANLFSSIDTSNAINLSLMFAATFSSYSGSTSATIPSGLFSSIDTSSATDLSNMFFSTFGSYASRSAAGTIPVDLFYSVNTTNATNLSGMFSGTFFNYTYESTTASIPSGLFDFLDTSNATDLSYLFGRTFEAYAHDSVAAEIPANLFDYVDASSATNLSNMFRSTFQNYAYNSATATIPIGLFDSISTPSATDMSYMFFETFRDSVYNSPAATIPAGLFDSIDTSKATDLYGMFNYTFYEYARSSTIATIPSGLFGSIDTSNAINLASIFSHTFSYYAYNSTIATIPANLFDSISIPSAATSLFSLGSMFYGTFSSYAYNSPVANIPAGLFDSIDTSSSTFLLSMFSGTFSSYAYNSPVATIPSGLFDSIDTSSADNLFYIFDGTFSSYAYNSPVATIPANLFDSIDTSNATDLTGMFKDTFSRYAYSSSVGTIPSGLFNSIDLSSATTIDDMFNATFRFYSYERMSMGTNINDIWGSANFASKVTASNVAIANSTTTPTSCISETSYKGVFCGTFNNMRSLGGSAQTFINTYIGGITPNIGAVTFSGTQVSDYITIHANWK